jgi:hypothetical protein
VLDFPQADIHGLLVEGSFFRNPPAQVDCLETAAVGGSQFPQARKYLFLEGIAFRFEITESGAHKKTEGAG